jgi:hypothetical protein
MAEIKSVQLKGRTSYAKWWPQVKWKAKDYAVWSLVDPDGPDAPAYNNSPPAAPPAIEELKARLDARRTSNYQIAMTEWNARRLENGQPDPNTKPNAPFPAEYEDVMKEHTALLQEYTITCNAYKMRADHMKDFNAWLAKTVDSDIWVATIAALEARSSIPPGSSFATPSSVVTLTPARDHGSTQEILRSLRNQYAPSSTTVTSTVRETYNKVLEQGTKGAVNQERWYSEWRTAYENAKLHNIPEIQGPPAVKAFLECVARKMQPKWGADELLAFFKNDELGLPTFTLDQYGILFSRMAYESSKTKSGTGISVFATLGERRDASPEHQAESGTAEGSESKSKKGHKECPCNPVGKRFHIWKPQDCALVELAITGSTARKIELSEERCAEIRKALLTPKWKDLRAELEKKHGIKVQNKAVAGSGGSSKKTDSQSKLPESNLTFPVLDPMLFTGAPGLGVYSTLDFSRHPLSESTLLDNCGATHVVNDVQMLDEGTFVKELPGRTVEAGSSSLPVIGRGTRTIKSILNGKNGKVDLVLRNVAVVEGFHVNIVSEALLRKKGAWYHGYDGTLRIGDEHENSVLLQTKRVHNVVFIEYKPLSTYSDAPSEVPTSAGGVLIYPTLERKVKESFRRSRKYLQPRSDMEERWHARAGHLGSQALQKLVHHVRNVQITGPSRVTCEHCAQAYARQVISRRASERRSPRPFWRVVWDLFDFPVAYDNSSWLLVIKDEFSGKLFVFPLPSKEGAQVFETTRNFEHWVKRQYNLSICKMKHDQEKAVIAIRGNTAYELWCAEEGIELELSPSHTHEPNGGSERAGQEVIDKALAMRLSAGLPEKLWPETTLAAAYLYNMSPSYSHGWSSPNEVLDSWFRNYFRWYDPALVTRITVDLRPDWNGIYVYGARAYPMVKEREANQTRRAFKVIPRGHIGYLVGYCASNIYRIWVPVLDRVIVTRNVTFNENILYSSKAREQLDGHSVAEARSMVELIEEEEVRDAGSILDNLDIWNIALSERNTQESENLGGAGHQNKQDELPSISQEHVSGVEHAPTHDIGLMTPENTPEPEILVRRSMGDESAENHEHLSTTGEDAEEQSPGEDRAQDPPAKGALELASASTGQGDIEPMNRESETRSRADEELTVKPRRKYVKKQWPKTRDDRFGTRSRSRKPDGDSGGAGDSSMVAALSSLLEKMSGPGNTDRSRALMSSFWPDHLEELTGAHENKTVHAILAASVLQKTHPKLNARGGKTTRKIHQNELPPMPKQWKELENHMFGAEFKADCVLELSNLEARECWRVVPSIPAEQETTPLPLKWVFTYKVDADGFLTRCRSRIVVRGDLQEESTILSTYAATLAARSFRIACAIAAHFDLEMKQFDVVNAFVNATRSSEGPPVICKLPPGFERPGYVVEVDRALYGLRDSPALWYNDWTGTLKSIGLMALKEEACMFVDAQYKVFVMFYVDDVQVLYHKDDELHATQIIKTIKGAYELRDMGDAEWFLGVRVIRDRTARKIWLVHDTYIEKITKKFELLDGKCPSTPLPGLELRKYEGQASKRQIKEYQEKVGSVLYTAIMLRPDVAFAASILSQFLTNPGPEHLTAVNWTIKYLFGTRFLAIQYDAEHREVQLQIASDTSFADDEDTRRSSQGYTISLFGGLIMWRAARQTTVTTSSTEAEMLGASFTAKELMALKRLFRDLRLDLGELWTLFCDNQQTIRLIVGSNERIATKLRHVDIQNMWIRQEHQKGAFEVTYLPTNDMPADGLTKNLPRYKFEHFRALLNLQDVRGMLEKIE